MPSNTAHSSTIAKLVFLIFFLLDFGLLCSVVIKYLSFMGSSFGTLTYGQTHLFFTSLPLTFSVFREGHQGSKQADNESHLLGMVHGSLRG